MFNFAAFIICFAKRMGSRIGQICTVALLDWF